VTRGLRAGEELPLDVFVARIPSTETRNYVYLVMGNYARYAYRDESNQLPTIDLKIPKGLKASNSSY
jgi:soluble lytic murein transglycosylase-like protein